MTMSCEFESEANKPAMIERYIMAMANITTPVANSKIQVISTVNTYSLIFSKNTIARMSVRLIAGIKCMRTV